MFSITQTEWDYIDLYTLKNETTGEYAEIIPEMGASINKYFVMSGHGTLLNIIEGVDNFKEARTTGTKNFLSRAMFPFPNRLNKGQYVWEGESMQFPINKVDEGHQLHGFVADDYFIVLDSGADEQCAWVECSFDSPGWHTYYPFACELTVKFTLSALGLETRLTITNDDERVMPCGTGTHPYFNFGHSVNDLEVLIPSKSFMQLEAMIPTGKAIPFTEFNSFTQLGPLKFDHCFLPVPGGFHTTALRSQQARVEVSITQGSEDEAMDYIQVYTPPHRNAIAIEPMTCAPDAFNNGLGLWHLQPDESRGCAFTISAIPI